MQTSQADAAHGALKQADDLKPVFRSGLQSSHRAGRCFAAADPGGADLYAAVGTVGDYIAQQGEQVSCRERHSVPDLTAGQPI